MATVTTVAFFFGLGLRLEPRRGNSKAPYRMDGEPSAFPPPRRTPRETR
jgi:hypothetical protein